MHADDKENDEGPQVIDPGQPGVILHFVDYFSGMLVQQVVESPLVLQ